MGFEPRFLRRRRSGYTLLRGRGVEIGAFEHPALLRRDCTIYYADVLTRAEALERFPEVDVRRLVEPNIIIDVDTGGLAAIRDDSLDFVIACHVIEHVANPGRFIRDVVRALKVGGRLAIAAPDKRYTYDRLRSQTPLEQLERYYREGRLAVAPRDYEEMLVAVHPEVLRQRPERVEAVLASFHARREHLSVWEAAAFREFLTAAFTWCGANMQAEYEVFPDQNRLEHFGVWTRKP